MPKPSFRLLLYSDTGRFLPPPDVSVWFSEKEDADVLAALSSDEFDAVAVVEYPDDGTTPRLTGFHGSELDRLRLTAELNDPDMEISAEAEMVFDPDGDADDDDFEDDEEDEDESEGFSFVMRCPPPRRFDA